MSLDQQQDMFEFISRKIDDRTYELLPLNLHGLSSKSRKKNNIKL